MVSTEYPGGIRIPWQHNPESFTEIGNRISRAIQPVSNAYEDAAQTTGGRNTHGDKSGRGQPRKARPPATHDTPVTAEVYPFLNQSNDSLSSGLARQGTALGQYEQ